jgi:putative nucleotidyltransferase with HDIG domain
MHHILEQLGRAVEGGTLDLPLLPSIASQVYAACSREDCDARSLADLIRSDAAMAGHLLRIANSPLCMPRSPIGSLQQAISMLGIRRVQQLALVIACETRIFSVPGHDARVRALFRHSLATGLFAQEIARARRWNVEEAFLLGLLHDAGRPALLQALVDLCRAAKRPLDETAEPAIDEHHARVGSAMATRWALPERFAEVILYHHDPAAAPRSAPAAWVVRLADDLAHLCVGPRAMEEKAIREHAALLPLNLYPDELDGLLCRRDAIVATVSSLA